VGRREAQKQNNASAAATAATAAIAAITATEASTTDIISRSSGLITVTVFHGGADKPKARLSLANIALLYTSRKITKLINLAQAVYLSWAKLAPSVLGLCYVPQPLSYRKINFPHPL